MIPLGIRIYGLGAIATGLFGIAWGDFALQWEPVPALFPARTALAYLFAVGLVAAGVAVNWRRSAAAWGGAVLCGLYLVAVVVMHGAGIVHDPATFATWSGAAEQLALAAGGLATTALVSTVRRRTDGLWRSAVIAMALCVICFGVAHFIYLGFTAAMVPAWIPGNKMFWAAATGCAHIAAGIALLSGFASRIAAILLTVMFAAFGLLIHAPALAAASNHFNWVINAINLALTGAAWVFADGLQQPRSR